MIPKIIHYCWYGNGEKNELTKRCIESWRRYCPDYELIEWNESNSDFSDCDFAIQAYELKKWAFVSDYIRLKAVYTYGGIYMDTDVELFKSLDDVIENEHAVLGYADGAYINPALFAFESKNELCGKFLDYYNDRSFVDSCGNCDLTPNNIIYTKICMNEKGFKLGDSKISCGNAVIHSSEFFSPFMKRLFGQNIYVFENYVTNDNTYAIHYATYSWKNNDNMPLSVYISQLLRLILPVFLFYFIKRQVVKRRMRKYNL